MVHPVEFIYFQVFFRAGVLGLMEEIREEKISQILSWLQAAARGKMSRKTYRKLQAQKVCSQSTYIRILH